MFLLFIFFPPNSSLYFAELEIHKWYVELEALCCQRQNNETEALKTNGLPRFIPHLSVKLCCLSRRRLGMGRGGGETAVAHTRKKPFT